jgi:hypothetical protein
VRETDAQRKHQQRDQAARIAREEEVSVRCKECVPEVCSKELNYWPGGCESLAAVMEMDGMGWGGGKVQKAIAFADAAKVATKRVVVLTLVVSPIVEKTVPEKVPVTKVVSQKIVRKPAGISVVQKISTTCKRP